MLAKHYLIRGAFEEPKERIGRVIDAGLTRTDVLLLAAQVSAAMREVAVAQEQAQRILVREPRSVLAHRILADALGV